MARPKVLVTNDDGIASLFLVKLVGSLRKHFDVTVVAPEKEQSWIGRAVTRYSPVHANEWSGLKCPAWAVSGTPSDCVNIALGHLLDAKPDLIVSGINIGYNTTMPLILSSGTLAGAIEGAAWGLPAVAFSQRLPVDLFDKARKSRDELPNDLDEVITISAGLAARMALEHVGDICSELIVHNINFPYPVTENTPVEMTVPADVFPDCFFKKQEDGAFIFEFKSERKISSAENTDFACLGRGTISHSILNYSQLGNR